MRVIRPLGLGLSEKAIEAVEKWRLKPSTKDGRPVSTLRARPATDSLGLVRSGLACQRPADCSRFSWKWRRGSPVKVTQPVHWLEANRTLAGRMH
ncbi:MAG: hypothetical protein HYZ57_19160, partial [Acidobacteria bacterium]|nr:hypothetical protein [Acidobacteriota bacterium]